MKIFCFLTRLFNQAVITTTNTFYTRQLYIFGLADFFPPDGQLTHLPPRCVSIPKNKVVSVHFLGVKKNK